MKSWSIREKEIRRSGFTLIELSIVLVIIALIVGGVLVGRDLIQAAEVRRIIQTKENYQSAVNLFRSKLGGLPGDTDKAIAYFGALSSCPSERNTYGTFATCNGNNDGLISNTYNVPELFEQFRFWQHLGNTDLINGRYTGRCLSCNSAIIGQDVPAAGLGPNHGWMVGSIAYWRTSVLGTLTTGSGNMMFIGLATNTFPNSNLPVFSIRDIDAKIDDGSPTTGNVITGTNPSWYSPACWQSVASANNYAVNSTSITCPLIFLNPF